MTYPGPYYHQPSSLMICICILKTILKSLNIGGWPTNNLKEPLSFSWSWDFLISLINRLSVRWKPLLIVPFLISSKWCKKRVKLSIRLLISVGWYYAQGPVNYPAKNCRSYLRWLRKPFFSFKALLNNMKIAKLTTYNLVENFFPNLRIWITFAFTYTWTIGKPLQAYPIHNRCYKNSQNGYFPMFHFLDNCRS